jgi:hypothetical protein
MMGEELNSSYITERGLVGDRTYAVVDKQTGRVASAKNPRKWGKLFDFRSMFIDSPYDVNDIPPPRRRIGDSTDHHKSRSEIHMHRHHLVELHFLIHCSKLITDSTSSWPLSVKLYSTLRGV